MSAHSPGGADAELLGTAPIRLHGRVMPASNATFIGEIGDVRVVYKPVAGERPLWDFPDGTLAQREVAAYAVSQALGWDVVPLTFLRDGPHGPGMVQLWQEPDEDQTAVDIVAEGEVPPGWCRVFDGVDGNDSPVSLIHEDTAPLRRMAIFDVLVNNGDRKGGHVLPMSGGHRYGVDHGVSFHVEDKLRTVLWGWAGQDLLPDELDAVRRVAEAVDGATLGAELAPLVTPDELRAFVGRCALLLRRGSMPSPGGGWPSIPWPPF